MFNYFWQKKYDTIKVKPIANITKNASYIYKYKNQQNLLVTMSRPWKPEDCNTLKSPKNSNPFTINAGLISLINMHIGILKLFLQEQNREKEILLRNNKEISKLMITLRKQLKSLIYLSGPISNRKR